MRVSSTVRALGLCLALAATACAPEAGREGEAPPTPPPQSAAAEPTPAPTEEPPAVVTAVHEVPFQREPPTPRPTVDVAAIPNFDRPLDPTPPGRAGQLARCLTFTAETVPQPGYSGLSMAQARVRARNACNVWIPAEDTAFEVQALGAARGERLGRARGAFQTAIPPNSSTAETFVGIDCPENLPGGCRYAVSGWWVEAGEGAER